MVHRGEFLGSEKVVHISGIPIGLMELTEQDEEHIRTGIQLKVDAIMIPGIRNVGFFNRVKYFVGKCHLRVLGLIRQPASLQPITFRFKAKRMARTSTCTRKSTTA